jgi:hypothetical protein
LIDRFLFPDWRSPDQVIWFWKGVALSIFVERFDLQPCEVGDVGIC